MEKLIYAFSEFLTCCFIKRLFSCDYATNSKVQILAKGPIIAMNGSININKKTLLPLVLSQSLLVLAVGPAEAGPVPGQTPVPVPADHPSAASSSGIVSYVLFGYFLFK